MYRISEDYVVRDVIGDCVVVPVKGSCDNSTGFFAVNDTGKVIVEGICAGKTDKEIILSICGEYETDEKTAAEDFNSFVAEFIKIGIIEEI